jgi:hypothetical protein
MISGLGLSGLMLAAALAWPLAAEAVTPNPISPAELSATVKTLASDAFEGRAPGTPGEARTVDYLIGRFKALGLAPGGEAGSWTQSVPLVRTQVGPAPKVDVTLGGAVTPLVQLLGVYVSTLRKNYGDSAPYLRACV